MGLVRALAVDAPVKPGQVLLADILGTGVDLIASGSAKACSPAAPAISRKEDAP
jgi:CxxC motif-containing protein